MHNWEYTNSQFYLHPRSPFSFISLSLHQLGHNGVTPESCWLVDELSVAVPTKGIKYIFPCKCWLAKDREMV